MSNADSNKELTTTLHLGLRSLVDASSNSALNGFLTSATEQEREAISAINGGDGRSAMVFIHRGPAKGSRFLITQEGASIGRSPSNSIFLDDVTVSRSHATIEYVGGGFSLKDSGSLNGTYLNNVSITEQELKTGDEIQIGKFHALFVGAQGKSEKQQGEK
jgi:hypothetical protein